MTIDEIFLQKKSIIVFLPVLLSLCMMLFVLYELPNVWIAHWEIKDNISIDYIIGISISIILTVIMIILPFKQKRIVFLSWFLKLGILLLIALFYEQYYTLLDSFLYYLHSSPYNISFIIGDGTRNVSIVLSYLYYIIPDSFRAGSLIFSLLGFIGIYYYWISVNNKTTNKKSLLLFAFFLFPSLIFWSSFIGKEAILLFFIGMYMIGFIQLLYGKKIVSPFILISISFLGFGLFRFWLLTLFSLSLFFSIIFGKEIKKSAMKIAGSLSFLIVSLCVLVRYFQFREIPSIIGWLQFLAQRWSIGGSGQTVHFDSISSLLVQYPWMMFTSLFRPLFFEGKSFFMLLAGIENAALLILFVIAIYLMIRNWENRSNIMVSSFIHVICYAIMYGLVSYQNLGTAMRFKVIILPFMITFIYFSIRRYIGEKIFP